MSQWIAFILTVLPFAVSMSLTPGPNNALIMASVANFGIRASLAHAAGIAIGFPIMIVIAAVGFGRVLSAYPEIHAVLRWVGAAYLLWLAWRIANAAAPGAGGRGRPMTFIEAALFQWVNPKAWIIVAGTVTTYTTVGGNLLLESIVIAALFGLSCVWSSAVWGGLGAVVRRVLQDPVKLRWFNWIMAALLVLSLVPLVWG